MRHIRSELWGKIRSEKKKGRAADLGGAVLGDVCVRVVVPVDSEGRSTGQELVHQHAEAPPVHRLDKAIKHPGMTSGFRGTEKLSLTVESKLKKKQPKKHLIIEGGAGTLE